MRGQIFGEKIKEKEAWPIEGGSNEIKARLVPARMSHGRMKEGQMNHGFNLNNTECLRKMLEREEQSAAPLLA